MAAQNGASGGYAVLAEHALDGSYGCCNAWSMVLVAPDQDPPDWFCPPSDVGEATGLCTLGEPRYFAALDPDVWEMGDLGVVLCVDHAERARRVGGVVHVHTLRPPANGDPGAPS
jgi:hypothetical protein